MQLSFRPTPAAVSLRFYGEFEVRFDSERMTQLSPQQRALVHWIANSPSTAREIARMALETDLADLTDRHFKEKFRGPDNEEILDAVLPCLPESERDYWQSLREGPGDTLHNEITPVFLAFEVSLKHTGIEELSAGRHGFKKVIGPTIDAADRFPADGAED